MEYSDETLQQLHEVELELLIETDRVCREIGISYFLDSGTALGAARHQGFIPWDDDVDIGMLRDEYDRFLEMAPEHLSDGFLLCTPENTAGYAPMFSKLIKKGTVFKTQETKDAGFDQGIFIDIFPYDAVSSDRKVAQEQASKCAFWQRMSYLYNSSHITVPHKGMLGRVERVVCALAHPLIHGLYDPSVLLERFNYWAQAGTSDPSGRYMSYAYPIGEGIAKDTLVPPRPIIFEERTLNGPAKIDAYLTYMYGDWRMLPPEEDRTNHAPLEIRF